MPVGAASVLSEPLKQSGQDILLLKDADRCAVTDHSGGVEVINRNVGYCRSTFGFTSIRGWPGSINSSVFNDNLAPKRLTLASSRANSAWISCPLVWLYIRFNL